MPAKILAMSGSARAGSLNKKLLTLAVREARALGAELSEIDLRSYALPVYDGDVESLGFPPGLGALRDAFKRHNAFLIASPEYNGGVAPLLKNSFDWASRPYQGEPNLAVIQGKVAAIMSASAGLLGGSRMQAQFRVSCQVMRVVLVPETVNIPLADSAFAEDGTLKDKATHVMMAAAVRRLIEIANRLNP
jgi:NAD(P)H-dependent FMN reductase